MIINPLDYTISDLNKLSPQQGRVLIAEPFMDDQYFKRSVVLLTEYDNTCVSGFVLNKPLEAEIHTILPDDFPKFDAPIFIGGPVKSNNVFYIHNQGDFIEGSEKITGNLYWSENFDQLKELIIDQQIFPNEVKFFIGYSAWDSNQLEEEIEAESWIISDLIDDSVNELNKENLWGTLLRNMGPKHSILSNFPEDPSLN